MVIRLTRHKECPFPLTRGVALDLGLRRFCLLAAECVRDRVTPQVNGIWSEGRLKRGTRFRTVFYIQARSQTGLYFLLVLRFSATKLRERYRVS